jgi:DUSAM domain-containing protein
VTEETDWDEVWHLEQQVFIKGVPLELTESTRALLLRTARQVAIHDEEAQAALQQESSAAALLREIRRRIREGSHRVSDALHRCYRLRDAGDLEGARKLMEELLAVEVVPLYREEAEIVLEKLARREPTPRPRKPRPES